MILKLIVACILSVGILSAKSTQSVDLSTFLDVAKCDQVIKQDTHSVCFDYKKNGPKAVWYSLTGSLVNEINLKNRPTFKKNPQLSSRYQIDHNLYSANGMYLDIGHLAPDGAFDYDLDILKDIYYTSNATPQYHYLNAYYWYKSEQFGRYLAVKYGTINVIDIVLYGNDVFLNKQGYTSQGIPTEYIKILYNNKEDVIHCFRFQNSNDKLLYDKLIHHEIKCNKISLKHLLF